MTRSLIMPIITLWCTLPCCTKGALPDPRTNLDPCALDILGDLPCKLESVSECIQFCQTACRDVEGEKWRECIEHCYCSDECVVCWQNCSEDDEESAFRHYACHSDCLARCGMCGSWDDNSRLICYEVCGFDICDDVSQRSNCSLCDHQCYEIFGGLDSAKPVNGFDNDCRHDCLGQCDSRLLICHFDCNVQCALDPSLEACDKQCEDKDLTCRQDCLSQYNQAIQDECRADACGEECAACVVNHRDRYLECLPISPYSLDFAQQ